MSMMLATLYNFISIHAPPRGATQKCSADGKGANDFNSRPSARGDFTGSTTANSGNKFQFTPLREGRLQLGASCLNTDGISIHAPPRGATTLKPTQLLHNGLFQFTPLREGRLNVMG